GVVLVAHEHEHLGAERLAIEIDSLFAPAVKEQIRLDLHGISYSWLEWRIAVFYYLVEPAVLKSTGSQNLFPGNYRANPSESARWQARCMSVALWVPWTSSNRTARAASRASRGRSAAQM